MANKINENILRRLIFIKYLYKLGLEQSLKSEPMCCISILTFHDSIELFLHLTSEYLNVGKNQINFMEYWDLISKKLKGKELYQKESIRRLNKTRVLLKHHGNLPSKFDVDNFKISVTNFFVENTSLIFKLEFEEISLLDLITLFDKTKESLIEATKLIKEKDFNNALEKITIAFEQLKNDFYRKYLFSYNRRSFSIRQNDFYINSYQTKLDLDTIRTLNSVNQKIFDHIVNINRSLEDFENIILIICMGVNYNKYITFNSITPTIFQTLNGNYRFQISPNHEKNVNIKNVQYCFDFVLETAITLQGMYENINQNSKF